MEGAENTPLPKNRLGCRKKPKGRPEIIVGIPSFVNWRQNSGYKLQSLERDESAPRSRTGPDMFRDRVLTCSP